MALCFLPDLFGFALLPLDFLFLLYCVYAQIHDAVSEEWFTKTLHTFLGFSINSSWSCFRSCSAIIDCKPIVYKLRSTFERNDSRINFDFLRFLRNQSWFCKKSEWHVNKEKYNSEHLTRIFHIDSHSFIGDGVPATIPWDCAVSFSKSLPLLTNRYSPAIRSCSTSLFFSCKILSVSTFSNYMSPPISAITFKHSSLASWLFPLTSTNSQHVAKKQVLTIWHNTTSLLLEQQRWNSFSKSEQVCKSFHISCVQRAHTPRMAK